VRENGGQYTHGAIWLAIAFAKLKNESATRDLLNLLNPIGSAMDLRGVYRYEKEPYVMAGDIGMAAPYEGRAGWSWYTGAAGWMYQAILHHYLGISRQGDELYLDPCVPASFRTFQVRYRFGKSSYNIDFLRGSGAVGLIKTIEVDRNLIVVNHFTLIDDGTEHSVTVRLSDKHHD
jgi:cellobiose phosphorylase